jgi:hypothetical protein
LPLSLHLMERSGSSARSLLRGFPKPIKLIQLLSSLRANH